jgi:hypothetical protein
MIVSALNNEEQDLLLDRDVVDKVFSLTCQYSLSGVAREHASTSLLGSASG